MDDTGMPTPADDQFADVPQVESPSPFQRNNAETRELPAITTSESNMSGGIGSAKSRMERSDVDPGMFEIAGQQTGAAMRPSVPFRFPYADDLDNWLPLALPILMLAWFFYVLWGWTPGDEENSSHPGWAGLIPVGLLLVSFLFIWYPIYAGAIRKVSNAMKFALPPTKSLRAVCVASLPFAMGGLFWIAGESIVTAVTGLILGTLLAIPAAWFLYRLRETELVHAGIAMVIAGLVSGTATGAVLWGGNFLLNHLMASSGKAGMFAGSPMGPNLSWEIPPAPTPVKTVAKKSPTTVPATQGANAVGTAVATGTGAGGTPSGETAAPGPATQSVETATANGAAKPVPGQDLQPRKPIDPKPSDPLAGHPTLYDGRILPVERPILHAIYPLAGGRFVALVHSATESGSDDVVVYKLTDKGLEEHGQQTFAATVARSGYAVSPDGNLIARVSRFGNTSSIQVVDVSKAGLVVSTIPLVDAEPRLVGFLNNTTLLCHWDFGEFRLAAFDLKDNKETVYALSEDRHAGILAITPDGKAIAAVGAGRWTTGTNTEQAISVRFWTPPQSRNALNLSTRLRLTTENLMPTGLAVSPEGTRVAVAFEDNGQLQIMIASKDLRRAPIKTHIFPGGLGLRPTSTEKSVNRLIWLPYGDLLQYGQITIDANTGLVAANMSDGSVVDQHLITDPLFQGEKETEAQYKQRVSQPPQNALVHFLLSGPGGRPQLLQAKVRKPEVAQLGSGSRTR